MPTSTNSDVAVRLTEAAATILMDTGPEGLNLRAVATAADTSTMGVYTNFGSMGGLVSATLAESHRRLNERITAIAATDDALADLMSFGVAYLENALVNPNLYMVMTGTVPLGRYANDPAVTTPLEAGAESLATLTAAVERAMTAGALTPSPPESVASQFFAAMHGFVLLHAQNVFGPTAVDDVLKPLMGAISLGAGATPEAVRIAMQNGTAKR